MKTTEFIKREYENRAKNKEEISNIIDKMPEKKKSNARLGSHYDWVAKRGDFYFRKSDFITAITKGEHSFYGFGETSAIDELKEKHKSLYQELSNVIDMRVKAGKIIEPNLEVKLEEESIREYEEKGISSTLENGQEEKKTFTIKGFL